MPKQREIKVWVRPTLESELILHDSSLLLNERGSRKAAYMTVPATITLTIPAKPKRKGK